MEGDSKLRYVCKLCSKRYPCGKSLGGHMRSHVIVNSGESKGSVEPNAKKASSLNGGRICKSEARFEFGGHSGYGLRENPKKTWRVSGSSFPVQEEKLCKQCGKGFQSLKALCGHMACHSEKERTLNDDYSWTSETQMPVMDGHSDTEPEAPARPRRLPPLLRQKKPPYERHKSMAVKSSSPSPANGSSSVSEIMQEQEEVAMCLIMLSRDSGNWDGVNSVTESSENNSVVLEIKSSSIVKRIGKQEGLNCAYNGDDTVETVKLGELKLRSGVLDDEPVQLQNFDSACFRNGAKKVESDVSVDELLGDGEYKKITVDDQSRIKPSDAAIGLNRCKRKGIEMRKTWTKENEYSEFGIASNSMRFASKKRLKKASDTPKSYGEPFKKTTHSVSSSEICTNARNKREIEPCHDKSKIAQDMSCNADRKFKSKKSKGRECPICLKVFKTGQALGGHKRSHFIRGSKDSNIQTPLIKQELPDLLDLNLPAPTGEEPNEHGQFLPW